MAFFQINSNPPEDSETAEIFDEFQKNMGMIPDIWKIQGDHKEILKGNYGLSKGIAKNGRLEQLMKEKMALIVAVANSNSYCIEAHLQILHSLGLDTKLLETLKYNFENAPLPDKELALLRFAIKLTKEPFKVKEADMEALKELGWDKDELFESVIVVSHLNYVNRISAGLGLIPEHLF